MVENDAISLVDLLLVAVGLFYAAGAYMVTRAALMSMFLDRALAGLEGKAQGRSETAVPIWHVGSAAIVLAGGITLILRFDAASWLFVISALGQALYLAILEPRYFDVLEPPDPEGRRQTTNAFIIYCAATAFVLWAHYTGRLQSWDRVGLYWLVAAGGVLAAYAAWVLRQFAWKLAHAGSIAGNSTPTIYDNDAQPIDPAQVRRLKVMADYRCHPLWSLDDGMYGDIDPALLGLSAELTRDLTAWAAAHDASLNPDDPAHDLWSPDQRQTHDAQGHDLARRLATERPDLTVFAWDLPNGGVIEMRPDEGGGARP